MNHPPQAQVTDFLCMTPPPLTQYLLDESFRFIVDIQVLLIYLKQFASQTLHRGLFGLLFFHCPLTLNARQPPDISGGPVKFQAAAYFAFQVSSRLVNQRAAAYNSIRSDTRQPVIFYPLVHGLLYILYCIQKSMVSAWIFAMAYCTISISIDAEK